MYGMGSLMGSDQTAGEIPGTLYRAVFENEHAVPFHGRFPFRGDPHDRRPFKPAAQEIRQIEIGDLDVASDKRLLLLVAGWVRQFYDRDRKTVGLYHPPGQGVVSPKHAKAVAIMGEG